MELSVVYWNIYRNNSSAKSWPGRSPVSKPLAAGEASPGTPEDGVNEPNMKTASSSPNSGGAAVMPAEVDEDEAPTKIDESLSEQQPPTRVMPHALDSSNLSESNFWFHMTETLDACFNIPTVCFPSAHLHVLRV